jgi:hypothetical protein
LKFPTDLSTADFCEIKDMIKETQAQMLDNSTQAILDAEAFYANLTSTININGITMNLTAPPLSLGNLGMLMNPFNASSIPIFRQCFNNQELTQNFTPRMYCVTNNELYSVGFSKNLSLGILIAQGVWCVTTWMVWYYVTRASRILEHGNRDGLFRSTVILNMAMQSELGNEVQELSELGLKKELSKTEGIGLSYIRSDTRNGIVGMRRRNLPT